jgi:hypothetical protein
VRLGGQTVRLRAPAGVFETWQGIATKALTVYSTDIAGNPGRAVSARVSRR